MCFSFFQILCGSVWFCCTIFVVFISITFSLTPFSLLFPVVWFICTVPSIIFLAIFVVFIFITFSLTSIFIFDWFFISCGVVFLHSAFKFFFQTCFLFPFYNVLLKHSAFRKRKARCARCYCMYFGDL